MFGPRFGTIFASRWRALWFAGSVLLLAYCSTPAPEAAPDGDAPAGHPAANPWARDPAR